MKDIYTVFWEIKPEAKAIEDKKSKKKKKTFAKPKPPKDASKKLANAENKEPPIYLKKKWEFCGRELSCHTYHVGFSEESYISAGENDDRTYKIDHLKKVEAWRKLKWKQLKAWFAELVFRLKS